MASNTSTSSSSTAAATVSGTQPSIYCSKWGNVIILDRQNYPSFASTCRATLIVAGAWNIVQGTEATPTDLTDDAGKDWSIRRGRALQIMFNSTSEGIRDKLDTYITDQDAKGLWEHLATYNQSSNTLFVTKVMESFHNESYKPPNDTIDAFAARLIKAQKLLADTEDKISDKNLRLRLIMGLPNTHIWQTAKQFVINQYSKFDEAVSYLQSVEATFKESQPDNAVANTARARGNQRGRGRGRGRGQGRGRSRNNYQGRGRDQRSDEWPISSNQCSWCLKEGHWKKDCRAYLKARTAARSRAASKDDANTSDTEEAARFASADNPSLTATAYIAGILPDIENRVQSESDDEV